MANPQKLLIQKKVQRLRRLRTEAATSFDRIEREVVKDAANFLKHTDKLKSHGDATAFLAGAAKGLLQMGKTFLRSSRLAGKELELLNRQLLKSTAADSAGKAYGASSFLLDIEEAGVLESFALGVLSPSFWFEIIGTENSRLQYGSSTQVESVKSKAVTRIRRSRAECLKTIDTKIRDGEKLINAIIRGIDISRIA